MLQAIMKAYFSFVCIILYLPAGINWDITYYYNIKIKYYIDSGTKEKNAYWIKGWF